MSRTYTVRSGFRADAPGHVREVFEDLDSGGHLWGTALSVRAGDDPDAVGVEQSIRTLVGNPADLALVYRVREVRELVEAARAYPHAELVFAYVPGFGDDDEDEPPERPDGVTEQAGLTLDAALEAFLRVVAVAGKPAGEIPAEWAELTTDG